MEKDGKGHQLNKAQDEITQEGVTNSNQELLEYYFALPERYRDQQFPSTARAAKMVGVSQRTIQLWVEIGRVKAVFIGRKCRVSIDSLRTYLKELAIEQEGY